MGGEVRSNSLRRTILTTASQVTLEHPAQGHAIDNTAVNGKADDPSRELIHYHQDPVGS